MPLLASIIIPNWNGLHHLDVCLQALRRQRFEQYEVILVDNNSSDGSQKFVAENFSEVRVVELTENRGFTGACNAGYAAAQGDIILLLNNDTEVDPGWLSAIMDAFQRHPEAGIIASKILLFDRRDHFHTAGDFYRIDGIPGNRGVWQKDLGQYDQEEFIFGACGGAAAYRRSLIDEIGFLDESFYFSCEDVDISWRSQLAGWKVLYVPTAIVYHKLKASGGNATASYYDGRNFLYLIWKNYPGSLMKKHGLTLLRGQLSITISALRSWRGTASRARIRGQLAGLFGIFRCLSERRKVQRNRRISDESLTDILTPVDETP